MKIVIAIVFSLMFLFTIFILDERCLESSRILSILPTGRRIANTNFQIINEKKYITANYTDIGRLGNMLFRFASLYGIGKAINRYPYFNGNNSLQIQLFREIADAFPLLAENIEIKVPNETSSKIVEFSDWCCKYEDPKNLIKYDNVKYLTINANYLHSYKFFHEFRTDIKELMTCSKAFTTNGETIAKQIWKNDETSHKLCIHIRRGDFVENPTMKETTSEFVIPATKHIYKHLKQKENVNISLTIINNDVIFSKSLEFPDTTFTSINILQNNSAALDMCFASEYCDSLLMSASLSTYSWWIGYLMEKQNNIFYNAKMTKTYDSETIFYPNELFLPHWKKLQQLENGTILRHTKTTVLNETRTCLSKALQNINSENFDTEWLRLNHTVDKCVNSLLGTTEVQQFPNSDETKLGILPKTLDAKCNVITLGIGKDVLAEKQISKRQKKCRFLGIDPDYKESGYMYISDLKGVYVQGKISFKKNNMTQFPTFTFQEFILQFYPHKTLEYLLMDIEGDEVALMKDLIENPEKYPIICQINVEYHDPDDTSGQDFFKDLRRSIQHGPYIPLKVEPFSKFNRVFYVNFKSKYCRDNYL